MEEITRYIDADTPLTKEEISLFGSLIMGKSDSTSNKEMISKINEIAKGITIARCEIADHITNQTNNIIKSNNDCAAKIIESNNNLITAINSAAEKLISANEKSLEVSSAGFISLINEMNKVRSFPASYATDTLLKYATDSKVTIAQNTPTVSKPKNVVQNSSVKTLFKTCHSCPQEIRDIIGKMSKSGKPCGTHFGKARKMLANSGVDTNKLIKKVTKKYKLNSNCNIWFAVSEYPDIVKKLDSLVSDSICWRF